MAVNEEILHEETTREPVLSPVDRVSEMLFGLFMALTFVGGWKVGVLMAGLGTALVVAINALGG